MSNKHSEKPQREMTKRQLSHWQRESRMQRIIFLAGIVVIVAVIAMVAVGVYMNRYKPYNETALKVDGKAYSMDYYIDQLAYLGIANGNPSFIQYMADTAVQVIEQNAFITREASKQFGLTVSEDEIKKSFEENKLPRNAASTDTVRAQLLNKKLSDYFDKNTIPAADDQRNVEAMFLESQAQVEEVLLRLNNVTNPEKFEDIAAQLSLESKSKEKRGQFGYVPKGVLPSLLSDPNDTVLEEKVFSADTPANQLVTVEDPDLKKSIGYWLIQTTDDVVGAPGATATPTPTAAEPDVHVFAMLLGSKAQALEIKAKLEAGGEGNDFAALAKANSQDSQAESNGGDFGMQTKDDVKSKFGDEAVMLVFPDDPAKGLPRNKISDPLAETSQQTSGGVWLLRVSALENKPIEGENRTILVNTANNDWQNKVWQDNQASAEVLVTEAQKTWAITQAMDRAQ